MASTQEPLTVRTGPALLAAGLVHNVLVPQAPGPYPTVVMLHGRFGNEEVMWIFRRTIPQNWLIVAPRAPLSDPNGGYSWYQQGYGEWPPISAFDDAVESVVRFMGALPALYNADAERTYLMGFSQGAAVSYCTAIRHPGLARGIAGLVSFAPTSDGTDITDGMAELPVFMAVGREDKIVPYEKSLQTQQILQKAAADLEYHEYDTGHKMTPDGMRDLQAWWQARE